MIDFALFVAIASAQMCLESPHRRECVAWAEQCLIDNYGKVDNENARDSVFEYCSELLDPTFFEGSF
jgi:hypothetical protein